jgi:uncharacterized protein
MRLDMLHALALALLILPLPGCSSSDDPGTAESVPTTGGEASSAAGIAQPFVWRVDGATGPSYLLGTIHVAVRLDEAIPPEIAEALEGARVVVLEADASPGSVTPLTLARYGMRESGPGLDQSLTPDQWTRLMTELVALGVPAEAIPRMRAWLPAMTLMLARLQRMPGMSANVGPDGNLVAMDQEILGGARGRGVPLRFLETIEAQLEVMAGFGEEHMTEWLGEMLDDPESLGAKLEEMIALYRAGDLEALERLTFEDEDMLQHPEYLDAMFTRRNRAWLPALREELERGGAFVAVGAGHFVGPNGLLRLLAAEGIEAVRIPPTR